MKYCVLALVCVGFASMGHAAEPRPLPSDGPGSDLTTTAAEPTVLKRFSLMRRLSSQFMKTFDADRRELAGRLKSIDVPYPFVRGNFHVNSRLSHDSVGTIEEIVRAAKATGTRIIGFTEHPSRSVDVVAENVKGCRCMSSSP